MTSYKEIAKMFNGRIEDADDGLLMLFYTHKDTLDCIKFLLERKENFSVHTYDEEDTCIVPL